MVRAIKYCGFQTQQWIAGKNAILHLLGNTFLDCRNVFLWNYAANQLINKFQTFGTLIGTRLKANPAVAILTATTGLAHKLALDFAFVSDGFAVSYLRLTYIGLNTKLATHTVNDNV